MSELMGHDCRGYRPGAPTRLFKAFSPVVAPCLLLDIPVIQAYNMGMKTALRPLLVAALAALPLAAAMAQTPAPARNGASAAASEARPAGSGRSDKKIQRIRTEDAGTRIDELRVGGETEKITVQPKTGGAAYEVKPAEGARGTAPANTSTDTNGSRVWNVLKF